MSSPAFKRVLVPIDFTEDEPEHGGERIEIDGHSFRITDCLLYTSDAADE